MAKRGIDEHPKVIDFADALGIPVCYAVGPLELFWHWVSKYRPTGDLTGIKPSAIAHAIRFPGRGEDLMSALIESGLVDRNDDGTLIVHDWSEHADNSVHQLLKKRNELFADGVKPFTRNRRADLNDSQTVHERFVNEKQENVNGSRLPEPEPEPEPEPDNTPQAPKGAVADSPERSESPDSRATDAVVARVATAFLSITGRKFQALPTAAIWKNLRARVNAVRISERTAFEAQCIEVIQLKTSQWKGHPTMEKHLNPETLFRPSNFEKYLVEVAEQASSPEPSAPGVDTEPEEPVNGRDYELKAVGKQVLKLVPGTDQPFDEEVWRQQRRAG